MEIAAALLRGHPEVALALVVALGTLLGRLKIAGFAFGPVTGALFAGLVIGQSGAEVSPALKSFLFLLFLFANGYVCGPQFFRSLKSGAAPLVAITVFQCVVGLAAVFAAATLLGLDPGLSAGLLSGALTQSAAIGTAADAIAALPVDAETRARWTSHIAIADALTYLFGFFAELWFMPLIAPRMLGFDLQAEARKLEDSLGIKPAAPGLVSAWRPFAARAFVVENPAFDGLAAAEACTIAAGIPRVFVLRLRRDGILQDATRDTVLRRGDVVALAGRSEFMLPAGPAFGPEVADQELLDIPVLTLDAIVANGEWTERPLADYAEDPRGWAVSLRRIRRAGQDIPVAAATQLQRGDIVTLVGAPEQVEAAAGSLGRPLRATSATDLVTLGLGVGVGVLVGIVPLGWGEMAFTLSASVGVLLLGLLLGWARAVRPDVVGAIPDATADFLRSFGLAAFVGATGLHAGPMFLEAVAEYGLTVFAAGAVCALLPPIAALYFGRYVLRMNPVLLLGATCGAQTMTAAMVAVQDKARSATPVLGFTLPYALGNIILTVFGGVIVHLMR
jgi:putative transport protein